MSLWNNIKGWFDNEEPQQKPEQPAGEAAQVVEEQSVEELFVEACTTLGIGSKILAKTGATKKFAAWYTGPHNVADIIVAISAFIEDQRKSGDGHLYSNIKRFVK